MASESSAETTGTLERCKTLEGQRGVAEAATDLKWMVSKFVLALLHVWSMSFDQQRAAALLWCLYTAPISLDKFGRLVLVS
eukprot:5654722-Amphidinium_carterae.1